MLYLHDSDSSVGHSCPVDGANHDASCGEWTGLGDEPVSQVQHVNHGTCQEEASGECQQVWPLKRGSLWRRDWNATEGVSRRFWCSLTWSVPIPLDI